MKVKPSRRLLGVEPYIFAEAGKGYVRLSPTQPRERLAFGLIGEHW